MEVVNIIIPVKDEQEGLEFLLNEYGRVPINDSYTITFTFVIDGRTNDSSKYIARKFSDNIIDQEETHGKGAGIKQAIKSWELSPTKYVILMDADGSYSFSEIPNIIETLRGGFDVVSGSRFLNKRNNLEGMSKLHIFGNKFLSKVSSFRNKKNITDLCTGMWGFNNEALKKLEIKSKGFDLEAELMGMTRKLNLNHKEIGIKWTPRKGGKSKLKSFRDGLIILLRIIRT